MVSYPLYFFFFLTSSGAKEGWERPKGRRIKNYSLTQLLMRFLKTP